MVLVPFSLSCMYKNDGCLPPKKISSCDSLGIRDNPDEFYSILEVWEPHYIVKLR